LKVARKRLETSLVSRRYSNFCLLSVTLTWDCLLQSLRLFRGFLSPVSNTLHGERSERARILPSLIRLYKTLTHTSTTIGHYCQARSYKHFGKALPAPHGIIKNE